MQVIKIGGAALSDPAWLTQFAQQVAGNTHRVIVHGGGPEISALSQRLGIAVEWHNGRRITTPEAMDVTAMVLTGRINKRIVRALCGAGLDAMGVSGEDAGLIRARVGQGGALGRVGEVTEVRAEILRAMITLGVLPVISPVSLGEDGGALNVNADEAAVAVAKALCAQELLFLTDVPAVRDQHGNRAELSTAEAKQLIEQQVATGGMAVKLGAAVAAVEAGVGRVRVGGLEMMNDEQAGTEIRREEVAAWR